MGINTTPAGDTGAGAAGTGDLGDLGYDAGLDDAGDTSTGNTTGAEDTGDEGQYDAELEALIEQAERAERGESRKPEPAGLLEGETYDSLYASAPPEVKRLMAQLRADYTRKTQDLAKMRKDLESQNNVLTQSRAYEELIAASRQEVKPVDAFAPESIEARIDAAVNKRLASVLEPLRQEQQQRAAADAYSRFVSENPDLTSDPAISAGVRQALNSNPNLDLETAYYAVKGRVLADAQRKAVERKSLERDAARASALKATGSGSRVGARNTQDLEGLDAYTIYQRLLAEKK